MFKKSLLFTTVVIIWSIVSYKFFSSFSNNDIPHLNGKHSISLDSMIPIKPHPKKLSHFNRDPFLGTIAKKKEPKEKTKKSVKKMVVEWPIIHYLGSVKNLERNNEVYFVRMNGELILWKKNETHLEVTLLRGSQEQLIMQYKKNQKSIPSYVPQ